MTDYVWTPTGTDITMRWRKMGWVPPSEQREYQEKWRRYQELPLAYLDEKGKEQYEQLLRRNKVARIK